MKKWSVGLLVILSCIVILTGCCEPYTQLTITNNTSQDLELVEWNGYYFDTGEVWDDGLHDYCYALLKGTSATRIVRPGYDYVSYWLVNGSKYYTGPVSVEYGQHATCVITSITSDGALSLNDFSATKKAEWQKAKNSASSPTPSQK